MMGENQLMDTFLIYNTKEADKLVKFLLKVKNGEIRIVDVTTSASNLVEIKFQSIDKEKMDVK